MILGEVALVTGASRGAGAATASVLAARGYAAACPVRKAPLRTPGDVADRIRAVSVLARSPDNDVQQCIRRLRQRFRRWLTSGKVIMQTGLRGQVVLVTGATANIGRAIALAFAAEEARLVLVGRDAEAGARVAELARTRGATDVLWRPTDVTVEDSVRGMVEETTGRFGGIDVLVNNVGGNGPVAPFADTTPEQWQADLDINLRSTLLCTHKVLPQMLERESGRIINIGSMAAIIGDPHMAILFGSQGSGAHFHPGIGSGSRSIRHHGQCHSALRDDPR